jgi:hypothetical protein
MSSKPPKYIEIDGVMQLNPAYKRATQNTPADSLYPDLSLPVLSSMDEVADFRAQSGQRVPLAPATTATIEMLQDQEISDRVGLNSDELVDGLGAVFSKYQAPMGLMNKLMALQKFDELEFIMDDSGSMATQTQQGTRWTESRDRLKEMFEFLAYVPIPPITIRFLNRPIVVSFHRNSNQSPQQFVRNAWRDIDNAFANGPSGTTPIFERLTESFKRGRGKSVSRYLFCDGEPNGGESDRAQISKLVKTRNQPQSNPLALMSCSDNDQEVEWMKELEEIAPYCSEYDDFRAEAIEVHRDQGKVFPYTKGFYMVGLLVGAMNPDDLDAMDESVPFTKWTLDNFLGVQGTEADFRRYFDGFKAAQASRQVDSSMDQVKKNFRWDAAYPELLREKSLNNVQLVREFKRQIEAASKY